MTKILRDLSRNQKLVPKSPKYYTDYYTKVNPTFIILRENFIKIIMFTAIGEVIMYSIVEINSHFIQKKYRSYFRCSFSLTSSQEQVFYKAFVDASIIISSL